VKAMGHVAGEKGIEIILERPENLHTMEGSREALQEVFNNLIGNAIKYNREGGWVKVRVFEDGDDICAEVRDNGKGIAEEHISRIFDEFYRVDGRRNAPIKGSGLGLSIVQTLVKAHWGTVAVESELGKGSSFTVRFPREGKVPRASKSARRSLLT